MALTATKYRTVMVIKVGLFNFWLLAYNYNTFWARNICRICCSGSITAKHF